MQNIAETSEGRAWQTQVVDVKDNARRIMPINVCGTAYHALPVPAAVEARPCVALVNH